MVTYRVQRGDTLGKIAQRFYGDARRFPLMVAANRIPDPDRLAVGQQLVIPDANVAFVGGSGGPGASASPAPSASVSESSTEKRNRVRLAEVHPKLASRVRAMLELCNHEGLAIVVTQGLRTWEEQDRLFAKGRTSPPIGKRYIVTKARGGESWHNFGLAVDIGVLDAIRKDDWDSAHPGWKRAAVVGKSLGLEWGGDWTGFKDIPHFQYTGGLTLADCRELFPSGLEAIWAKVS